MGSIQAPRMVKARSGSGKQKAGHVFKLLRIRGFVPFDAEGVAYYDDGVTRLSQDKGGTPVVRQIVDGQLQDVTWWQGGVSDAPCQRCSITGGARQIVRTTRPAAVRTDNRVPVVKSAGVWHVACLKTKLARAGRFGHDQRQVAGPGAGPAMPERAHDAVTQDVRTGVRTDVTRPVDPNADLHGAWMRAIAARRAYLNGIGGFKP
jgi:hypothetical protein